MKFSGNRLKNTEEIFLYDPDSGIVVTNIRQIDNNNVEVTIKVDAQCRLGEHVAQVRTRGGISDYRSFFVGALLEVSEAEPNNSLENAQSIELNVTVSGVCTTEDIDYFCIKGKKGQRISVEVEAIRLGYMFDPAIALLDKNRFEVALADDTPLTRQDPWFSVLLPEDGEYYIAIREAAFQGNADSRYRMHIGNFPRPVAAFPAGGKPNEKTELKFIDSIRNDEGVPAFVVKEITVPAAEGFRGGLFYADEHGITPSPIPFRISSLDNIFEEEPNDRFVKTPAIELPVAINGIIESPGDRDFIKFKAKKNQVFHFNCLARDIGSGLDPVLNIYGADKKGIVGNDDTGNLDSYIRFQAPNDGEYFLRVRDHLNRGQPDFVYRVVISPAEPELTLAIKRNDRYSQLRQTIAVPQGNRFAVLIEAKRKDFGGELKLIGDNLPNGVTMTASNMRGNLNTMPVVFEAATDAPIAGQLVDFRGSHVDDSKNISGSFLNHADFALGQPNNTVYYACDVDRLAMAVIEPLPYQLELIQPKVPMVQNGSIKLKVVAQRDEGFDEPIKLQFPFRSPGVGTTNEITLAKGKNEIEYPLNANNKAQVGNWPMYVIGTANVGGPAWASSQMAELEIAEPFVKMEFERANVERSQSTKIYGKIEQLAPFEGEATVEILGVPPNITIQSPLKFTTDATEVTFELQTTDKSPIGKHQPFAQVTIVQNSEPIVARAGKMLFHINKPPPEKKSEAAAKTAAK